MPSAPSMIKPGAEPFIFGRGQTDLVIIHGLGGTPDDYRLFAREISSEAISVHGLCLKGHGVDPKTLARYSPQDWIETIEQELRIIDKENRVYLMGVSYGAVLALEVASRLKTNISGLILVNPALNFKLGGIFQNLGLSLMSIFTPNFPKPGLSTDDKNCYAISGSLTAWPISTIKQSKQFYKRRVLPIISSISCPILILQNHKDPYVKGKQHNYYRQLMPLSRVETCVIPGHTHRPFKQPELRDFIKDKTRTFINSQLPQ